MTTALHIPERNNFRDLVSLRVPSPFSHDLSHGAGFEFNNFTSSARNDRFLHNHLERLIQYLSEGHPINLGAYPLGIYRRLFLLTHSGPGIGSANNPRGLVALAERFEGARSHTFFHTPQVVLVFFPAPQHVGHYFKAAVFSRRGGPGDIFPGSVGALSLLYDQQHGVAQITALQSSVNVSHPQARASLQVEQRNLSLIYFKWRFQMLDLAFDFINRVGISQLSIGAFDDHRLPLQGNVIGHDIIAEKATQSGFTLDRERSLLTH